MSQQQPEPELTPAVREIAHNIGKAIGDGLRLLGRDLERLPEELRDGFWRGVDKITTG